VCNLAPFLFTIILLLPGAAASAQSACPAGQTIPAAFTDGFAALNDALGGAMGSPAECAKVDSFNTSGDILQHTTGGVNGLAYWRKAINIPIWYDGAGTHYALNTDGALISWAGANAVDPPGTAHAPAPPVVQQPAAQPAPALALSVYSPPDPWTVGIRPHQLATYTINSALFPETILRGQLWISGSVDILLSVLAPNGNYVVQPARVTSGYRFQFQTLRTGIYTVVLDNGYSTFTTKNIILSWS
jgi:hypothetical protein